jgi:hypothetical protein
MLEEEWRRRAASRIPPGSTSTGAVLKIQGPPKNHQKNKRFWIHFFTDSGSNLTSNLQQNGHKIDKKCLLEATWKKTKKVDPNPRFQIPSDLENQDFLMDCCSESHFPPNSNKSQKMDLGNFILEKFWIQNRSNIVKNYSQIALGKNMKILTLFFMILVPFWAPRRPQNAPFFVFFLIFSCLGVLWAPEGSPNLPKGKFLEVWVPFWTRFWSCYSYISINFHSNLGSRIDC